MTNNTINRRKIDRSKLEINCKSCFGLCCVALYFSTTEGFPNNKAAGVPCENLQGDFNCRVHSALRQKGLYGCTTFDCFGAGQRVAQVTFKGEAWTKSKEISTKMYAVFLIMRQLHELLWYLIEALDLKAASSLQSEIVELLDQTEELCCLRAEELLKVDVAVHREKVNDLLIKTSELVRAAAVVGTPPKKHKVMKMLKRGANLIAKDLRSIDLRGAYLRGALLIAADLRSCNLGGADLIGADFRDADIRGADLSKAIFLTQPQVNVAKGDSQTKLPPYLAAPKYWVK